MTLRVRLSNGRAVSARTEEWLAALIAMLPESQREALFARVEKRIIAYETPGAYILRADPGSLIGRPGP